VALELRQFQLAAAQAGATFGVIYNRVLPSHMLDMPVDALAALAPSAPPAA
jgi:hypothetical protein